MPSNQRTPSARTLKGWRPRPGAEDPCALVDRLAAGLLTIEGRLPWSSNVSLVVSVGDPTPGDSPPGDSTPGDPTPGDSPRGDPAPGDPTPGDPTLLAVYKPGRGERELWDFPDGLYRREIAAAVLSESLGWGVVPPTVLRDDGPLGPGSLQLFVDADYEQHYFTLLDAGTHGHMLRTICAFDVVANNADRKSGHVLLGAGDRIWAIDHGLCFHPAPKLRTVAWDFVDEEIPASIVADLKQLTRQPPEELRDLLDGREFEALVDRASKLAQDGVFPHPEGDHPPYPWPLI